MCGNEMCENEGQEVHEGCTIEFCDRYSAMGIPRPDPSTMCKGHCEGTGYVPIKGYDAVNDDDGNWKDLFNEAEAKEPDEDGWHFVTCPRCNGTGLEPEDAEPIVRPSVSTVIVMSGGLDSSVLLVDEVAQGTDLWPITFDYGQKHLKEIVSAQNVCHAYGLGCRHKIVDMSVMKEIMGQSALTDDDITMPEGSYTSDSMIDTVVPNRNMVMLALATCYAISIGADRIVYAAHKGDHTIYPDCTPEFVEVMAKAILVGNAWTPVVLEAPYIDKSKEEIVRIGLELDAPFEMTWSCYNGEDRPCLVCGTCIERTEAFNLNASQDPSLYDDEWDKAVSLMIEAMKERKE